MKWARPGVGPSENVPTCTLAAQPYDDDSTSRIKVTCIELWRVIARYCLESFSEEMI